MIIAREEAPQGLPGRGRDCGARRAHLCEHGLQALDRGLSHRAVGVVSFQRVLRALRWGKGRSRGRVHNSCSITKKTVGTKGTSGTSCCLFALEACICRSRGRGEGEGEARRTERPSETTDRECLLSTISLPASQHPPQRAPALLGPLSPFICMAGQMDKGDEQKWRDL